MLNDFSRKKPRKKRLATAVVTMDDNQLKKTLHECPHYICALWRDIMLGLRVPSGIKELLPKLEEEMRSIDHLHAGGDCDGTVLIGVNEFPTDEKECDEPPSFRVLFRQPLDGTS